jgi:hypothetical protein
MSHSYMYSGYIFGHCGDIGPKVNFFGPQADILLDMFGVLADTCRSHVLPNSQVKGAPAQHCEVAARSTRNPASYDSMGRKRQAPEVDFSTQPARPVV